MFERTKDRKLIADILTMPRIWPHVGDDSAGSWKSFRPNMDERIWYVLISDRLAPIGLAVFAPRSDVRWEVHLSLFGHRRPRGTVILRDVLAWFFQQTKAERIIAEVPGGNRLAVKLAAAVMERIGTDRAAWKKNGALQDLELFGISR